MGKETQLSAKPITWNETATKERWPPCTTEKKTTASCTYQQNYSDYCVEKEARGSLKLNVQEGLGHTAEIIRN